MIVFYILNINLYWIKLWDCLRDDIKLKFKIKNFEKFFKKINRENIKINVKSKHYLILIFYYYGNKNSYYIVKDNHN